MDRIGQYNAEIRNRVNVAIGETWREALDTTSKRELRNLLTDDPALLRDLLEHYRAKPGEPYGFSRDPTGEYRWYFAAQEYAERFPLAPPVPQVTCDNVREVVLSICEHFKRLVENNRLSELFYKEGGRPKRERAAQRLFYGIADICCKSWNLDLTAESNGGRGPVDFKISSGFACRVNVETKLSKNDLVHGFEKQLPIYDAAEQAYASILFVIRVRDSMTNIEAVQDVRAVKLAEGLPCPDIFVVDGRI